MKLMTVFRRAAKTATVLLCGLAANASTAGSITLEIVTAQSLAKVGSSSFRNNWATIAVLATDENGRAVTDLGPRRLGEMEELITVDGWEIDIFQLAPGGCDFAPLDFRNERNGVYVFRVTTIRGGDCRWVPGSFLFSIEIDTGPNQGVGIGKLEIK